MSVQHSTARRGQPLAALAMLLLAWIGARTALYAATETVVPQAVASPAVRQIAPPTRLHDPVRRNTGLVAPRLNAPEPLPAPSMSPPRPLPSPVVEPPAPLAPKIAAGHQWLFLAGVANLPVPENAMAAAVPAMPASPPVPYLPGSSTEALRWSGDGWILWRQGGNGFNLPGAGLPGASLPAGAYGSSQAGFVIRYRLAAGSPLRPALYLRASSGFYRPRGEEAAIGLSLRPLPRLPVSLMGEVRVSRTTSGNVVRPAVAMVTELPPARLPLGFVAETYGQAGWVGGKDHTLFVDGQAKLDRPVVRVGNAEVRLGAGAWGGAQTGASRLDVGPSATLDLGLGPARARLSADYRWRVAGTAAPGSGAAVTFSAGF